MHSISYLLEPERLSLVAMVTSGSCNLGQTIAYSEFIAVRIFRMPCTYNVQKFTAVRYTICAVRHTENSNGQEIRCTTALSKSVMGQFYQAQIWDSP
jgi:hypothetical protein